MNRTVARLLTSLLAGLLAPSLLGASPARSETTSYDFKVTSGSSYFQGGVKFSTSKYLAWKGKLRGPYCEGNRYAVATIRVKLRGVDQLQEYRALRTCDGATSGEGVIKPRRKMVWARAVLYVCDSDKASACGAPKAIGPTMKRHYPPQQSG
ncbi:hypothetical protein [Nocardioides acrostichi]|uniref:Uncharacterized protein n=1 Tax=Nocardioides acrostichi TaxID=2784339 RepID=A0A930Y5C4_9ACTN|nr:hypothetical protein [Nocardioides acrostichi]MBF4161105.1 hypothetical protein [Nocardioides acrostichi]